MKLVKHKSSSSRGSFVALGIRHRELGSGFLEELRELLASELHEMFWLALIH
jgi:hypothetical protein